MTKEKLLIEVLEFGIVNDWFNHSNLYTHLKQKEEYKDFNYNDRQLQIWLKLYFVKDPGSRDVYQIKPEGHLALIQVVQLQKTIQIAQAAQLEAKAAEIQAKKADWLAIAAIVLTLIGTVVSIYFSVISNILAIEANDLAKRANNLSQQQLTFDKVEAARPTSQFLLSKMDTIISLQQNPLYVKK